ncbi:FkbM family methyltransferase [Rhodoblastus acidophilus]|uniref:FkbM family methyltransferase n=1 Tax=Rhodoblastus acidophilus TaxID=1074 RepID=UPI0022248241|nr:FkbM family methyltransferase [Rhodoblastus acidophilus]MCW2282998.1 FkbM family methyltransferase [Rhodoblastus acidophilus]MCW2331951.1 FkbM family methyltransferase [Rhodoblastus acidophilus]
MSQSGNRLTVHWDKYPEEVFIVTASGTLIHESIQPLHITTLQQLTSKGLTFPIRRMTLAVFDGAHEVIVRPASMDVSTFEQIFVNRDYDSANLPDEATTIIDLGANVGYATVDFAHRYSRAKIVAVEPDAGNFELLQENVRALDSRVVALQGAVWTHDGEINLCATTESGAALGSDAFRVSSQQNPGGKPVPCWKLSTLVEKAGFDHIDILKIDIEGAELELFSENPEPWLSKTGLLIIETHERFRPGSDQAVRQALAAHFEELPAKGENLFFRNTALA